jgi:hypothetical protein
VDNTNKQPARHDGFAILIGCLAGLSGGIFLGLCFVFLLGCDTLEMQLVIVLHTTLAMIVMGAWTAPSLWSEHP